MSLAAALLRRARAVLRAWLVPPYRTVIVAALPARVRSRRLYIVEEDGFTEQAAMLCPCRCGRVLQMNLLVDERPCWSLTRHADGTATLHPSIWRKHDCRSHFWFRRGRVLWCNPNVRGHEIRH